MKKQTLFLTFVLAVILAACNFSKGVKKDLNTGLSTAYNGFAVEEVVVTDAENKKLSNNAVALGTVLQVVASGVENYAEKNGRVFPGCSILLTDTQGKEIVNVPDAYADLKDGATAQDATTLTATLNTGNPMEVGKTYKLKTRFFDKQNPENEIVSTMDLVMK